MAFGQDHFVDEYTNLESSFLTSIEVRRVPKEFPLAKVHDAV